MIRTVLIAVIAANFATASQSQLAPLECLIDTVCEPGGSCDTVEISPRLEFDGDTVVMIDDDHPDERLDGLIVSPDSAHEVSMVIRDPRSGPFLLTVYGDFSLSMATIRSEPRTAGPETILFGYGRCTVAEDVPPDQQDALTQSYLNGCSTRATPAFCACQLALAQNTLSPLDVTFMMTIFGADRDRRNALLRSLPTDQRNQSMETVFDFFDTSHESCAP